MDKDEARRAYLSCMRSHPCFFITKCAKEREAYLKSQARWQHHDAPSSEWLDVFDVIL